MTKARIAIILSYFGYLSKDNVRHIINLNKNF